MFKLTNPETQQFLREVIHLIDKYDSQGCLLLDKALENALRYVDCDNKDKNHLVA